MAHNKHTPSGWDNVSNWYDGWVGKDGSDHHRKLAIPALLNLIDLQPETHLLDIGCGTGVLAPHVTEAEARYTGIDISRKLVRKAQRYHPASGTFMVGDARHLQRHIRAHTVDVCAYLLSIQDMNPLDDVLRCAAGVLRDGGLVAIVMTHPCFRIPRQSGWGYEQERKLQYRRIDRYLTPLKIPMKQHRHGATISFHRPLQTYINTLAACGLLVDKLDEITTYQSGSSRAERRANGEFPLFMALRARKVTARNAG